MEMKISAPERNWNYSHLLTTGALGYVFTPPCAPEYPMYRQLDVTLHAQPAERHYDPEVVRFKVASPIWGTAPIFPLNNGSSVSTIFAEEVEILLAERRAVWDVEHPRVLFEERLAQVDSIDLYFACLERFQQVFSHYPFLQSESMLHFNHFIRSEIQSFRETHRWPLFVTPIEQLL